MCQFHFIVNWNVGEWIKHLGGSQNQDSSFIFPCFKPSFVSVFSTGVHGTRTVSWEWWKEIWLFKTQWHCLFLKNNGLKKWVHALECHLVQKKTFLFSSKFVLSSQNIRKAVLHYNFHYNSVIHLFYLTNIYWIYLEWIEYKLK